MPTLILNKNIPRTIRLAHNYDYILLNKITVTNIDETFPTLVVRWPDILQRLDLRIISRRVDGSIENTIEYNLLEKHYSGKIDLIYDFGETWVIPNTNNALHPNRNNYVNELELLFTNTSNFEDLTLTINYIEVPGPNI